MAIRKQLYEQLQSYNAYYNVEAKAGKKVTVSRIQLMFITVL